MGCGRTVFEAVNSAAGMDLALALTHARLDRMQAGVPYCLHVKRAVIVAYYTVPCQAQSHTSRSRAAQSPPATHAIPHGRATVGLIMG